MLAPSTFAGAFKLHQYFFLQSVIEAAAVLSHPIGCLLIFPSHTRTHFEAPARACRTVLLLLVTQFLFDFGKVKVLAGAALENVEHI